MANEAEFAEGGFEQLSSWPVYCPAVGPARAAIGMVLTAAGFVAGMKDSTSVEIVEHDGMLGDAVGGASAAKPTLDTTTA